MLWFKVMEGFESVIQILTSGGQFQFIQLKSFNVFKISCYHANSG